MQALRYVREQKQIDQCVYSWMSERCQQINNLSDLNLKLEKILDALAKVRWAKRAGRMVPGVGVFIGIVGEVSEKGLKMAAEALILMQDAILKLDNLKRVQLLRCGVPRKASRLSVMRLGKEDVLQWKTGIRSTEVHLWDLRTKRESFASCFARNPELLGEKYALTFQHASRAFVPIKLRPWWRW